MEKIEESVWSWILYREGAEFYLSVMCGTVGLFTVDLQLGADEAAAYRERGTDFIEGLAREIRGVPARFQPRHIRDFPSRF